MPRSRSDRLASDVTLKIPRPLYERLAQIIDGTGFRSVTEFCVYALRNLIAVHGPMEDAGELSKGEVETLRRRLRALGYLD